jgi:hypothetical protein
LAWDAVSRSYILQHRNVVAAYVKAISQATAYAIDHQQETVASIIKYATLPGQGRPNPDSSTGARDMAAAFQEIAPYLRLDVTPDIKAVQNALAEMTPGLPKAKDLDPASLIDTSFTR